IVGIALFLVVAGLVAAVAFPDLFGPRQVAVPDVKDMERDEAIEELRSLGFVIGEEKEQTSEEVAEGNVVRTIPEAGKMRNRESEIQLFISTGKEKAELADYVGRNIDQAMELLDQQNYKSVDQEEE